MVKSKPRERFSIPQTLGTCTLKPLCDNITHENKKDGKTYRTRLDEAECLQTEG